MTRKTKPAPVAPPRQTRSRDTMDKLLGAARELLEEKSFEDVTVRALVDRARSSTGAFYARFENRDALLDLLEEACAGELRDALGAFLDHCEDPSVEMIRRLDPHRLFVEEVGEMTELLVSFHRRNRGLLRALALRPRERRKSAQKEEDGPVPPTEEAMPRLLENFGRFREVIGHPDPERALAVACAVVWGTVRERIVFPELLGAVPELDDQELGSEVAKVVLRYLEVPK